MAANIVPNEIDVPSGPRCNLEFKARLSDPANALRIAAMLEAQDHGTELQTDTYFIVSNGRLKLREITSQDVERAVLISYDRPETSDARYSQFRLTPISEPEALKAVLAAAQGVRGAVSKSRRLLIWNRCRIHLDHVEGLGDFIEFEVLSDGDESDDRERLSRLMGAFDLTETDAIRASYSDLLGL